MVTIEIEPDYGQFYAQRAGAEWASDQTTSTGFEEHLWCDGAFVTIATERRYGTTTVEVEVLDESPGEPDLDWQHVAESSLREGGPLELYSWGADAPDVVVDIDPGPVRLRVLWAGLAEGRFEGLDDEGESDEHLKLQIWPAPVEPSAVLRWWSGWVLAPPSDRSPDGRRQVEGLEAVVDVLPRLRAMTDMRTFGTRRPMPGGGEFSSLHAVLFDPNEDSWWVDGYDVRRTLREITEQEARTLLSDP